MLAYLIQLARKDKSIPESYFDNIKLNLISYGSDLGKSTRESWLLQKIYRKKKSWRGQSCIGAIMNWLVLPGRLMTCFDQ